jgi:hypothetical protein
MCKDNDHNYLPIGETGYKVIETKRHTANKNGTVAKLEYVKANMSILVCSKCLDRKNVILSKYAYTRNY